MMMATEWVKVRKLFCSEKGKVATTHLSELHHEDKKAPIKPGMSYPQPSPTRESGMMSQPSSQTLLHFGT